MNTTVLAFPGNEAIAKGLRARLSAQDGSIGWHRFPDGESLMSIDAPCREREVIVVCSFHVPDALALPLLYVARTAREFGARRVGLVVPYLAYMRQDTRFHPTEALSAPHFSAFLSSFADWVVTVDPHLHRNPSLQPLFAVPVRHVTAMPAAATWISTNVSYPVLIGPDGESAQWVEKVAALVGAPMTVLQKVRRGDRDVEVSLPDRAIVEGRTPVLVDDIIASGNTMLETLGHLRRLGLPPAVCVGVHGVFAENAEAKLLAAGAIRVVTSNTITHTSNAFDVTDALIPAIIEMLKGAKRSAA